jgi:thioredoxin reductase
MDKAELLVLGAGPAGIGAAQTAAKAGVNTVIVDRATHPGGQVYRAPMTMPSSQESDDEGDRLRQALATSPATFVAGCRVWNVGKDFRVDGIVDQKQQTWQPKAIVVASGTTERVVPFPGWTLPGVFGLAATTLLLKSQSMLPGEKTVVAGSGPLLFAVASGIIAGGGKVAAIVDLASRGEWLASVPALISRPKDFSRGLKWTREIKRAKVPIFYRHKVEAVEAAENGLEINITPVDASGRRRSDASGNRVRADALSIGNGLTPSTELTRMLGADHQFDADAGGWVPRLDGDQRTSISGLYAAGDGTGVSGADAAYLEGQIAGYAVAMDLGYLDANEGQRLMASSHSRLKQVSRVGRRMGQMMTPRPGLTADISPDTIVCRCEDVTRAEIDAAINDDASDINQLKSWTRCGMGPCQGRTCGDITAMIMAERCGGRENTGYWSPRPPLMAVTMDELVGDFCYEDIPIPEAAPL